MKILFITSSPVEVSSSAMISNVALMRGFVGLGHEVTLLTFKPYNFMKSQSPFDLDGIKVIRLNNNKAYHALATENKSSALKKMFKRALLNTARKIYHSFSLYDNFKGAIPNVVDFQPDEYYDLIISCSDPKSSHLLAKKFIQLHPKRYGKWIQFWGDPMYIDITRKSKLPGFIIKRQEKNLLQAADTVVYVSPMTLHAQQRLYPDLRDKLFFVPLAYPEANIYETKIEYEERTPIIGYYGSYDSDIRNIIPLYEAAKELSVQLHIVGDSNLALPSINHIIVEPRTGYRQIEEYEANTDILVVICNRIGTQIPGKIYYYAATNKPILVILDGDASRLREYLEPFNRFAFCDNYPHEIKHAIENLLQEKKRSQYLPQPDFAPTEVANQFLSLMNRKGSLRA